MKTIVKTIMNHQLEIMLKVAWSYHGTFYTWGGNGPLYFDCSGYVIEILKSVGVLPSGIDMTADGLFNRFAEVQFPSTGMLAFRKSEESGKMVHVGFMVDPVHVIHAAGGGSHIKTIDDAIRYNAFIKVRPVWKGAFFCSPFIERG